MNKLLIVILAVFFFSVVSAHTFVKRDAPKADSIVPLPLTAQLNVVKDKITELGNNIGKQIADSVNPEVIKKSVNNFIYVATKTLENLKAAREAKPAAAQ